MGTPYYSVLLRGTSVGRAFYCLLMLKGGNDVLITSHYWPSRLGLKTPCCCKNIWLTCQFFCLTQNSQVWSSLGLMENTKFFTGVFEFLFQKTREFCNCMDQICYIWGFEAGPFALMEVINTMHGEKWRYHVKES